MRNKLFCGAAVVALILPGAAFAQSTASTEFEGNTTEDIVVTGTVNPEVGGIRIPDQPKATVIIGEELIRRQRPGQSINEMLNLVPGVSNQSNDPYGSGGGNFRVRGFDSSRISQTLDGIPLNDSGNYALYTNQQVDSEIIGSTSVNLGATDVDSPTASAVGGTINIRTRMPDDKLNALASFSHGDFDFVRAFGMIDTGEFTKFGTKAFGSASWTRYKSPFNDYSRVEKQQYNGRIYQPLSGDDFISIAGHYNENRNNFFGSFALGNTFPTNYDSSSLNLNYPCTVSAARAGVADAPNSCGTEFDRRFNPSNTGNIRGNSRFTLADGLVLTVDPSFQYVKANGGGTVAGLETLRTVGTGASATRIGGFIGNAYYFGRDLNGDGDVLDSVRLIAPSQTRTRRYMVISNLIYDFNEHHRVRLAYTFDRAWHRQTGESGFVDNGGTPFDVFPINDPVTDLNGNVVQKRDRRSFATLHQISGQYRGEFFEDRLVADIGVRVPFFSRDLRQYCYTTSAGGNVDCIPQQYQAAYQAATPTARLPQDRNYNYNRVLPNIGLSYNFTPTASVFASYAKGLSVPGTDQLYNAIYFPTGTGGSEPAPETTDSFDLGFRYKSSRIQAQLSGWYIKFQNRIGTAFDAELGESVTRNLGPVDRYGFDAAVSYSPVKQLNVYVFGSYLNSEIKNDLLGGTCNAVAVSVGSYGCTAVNAQYFLPTAGKFESGVSKWLAGTRVQASLGPVQLGAQYKYTGSRWVNDLNLPLVSIATGGARTQIFGAKAPAYNIVDLDARISLEQFGAKNTFIQLNVSNLFDDFFVGYIGGASTNLVGTTGVGGSAPFVQVGVPRTVSATLQIGF
ncbi:iron complex outermembrane receptor protein [Sphingomonas sp. BE138]|uniref:TonB-dependent receptor n=1 Tax=Sphingomonas sp. BE138 TaxID=2817845 RepID=UPI002856A97C|nr:TonB-dependent receptor [Sphingomonas sp. BE138]MDR6787005.1 iron complex outermembrane receptor protein [Sphingomonas sp. BE138]